MSARIVIPSPQNLRRDSYAPCSKIDLTLRSNGEEKVQVMDSLGNFYDAGITAPTIAATINTTGAGAGFPAAKHWAYRYVYVAQTAFPKVEAITTGGGSPAPRSNPSPSVGTNASPTADREVIIPTTTDVKISHIWIYRTLFFDTVDEATTNSDAGNLYWIGSVANTIATSTVTFTDDGSDLTGSEQIENDNFEAPQFSLCVFCSPYFYGIGNYDFVCNVSIADTGIITFTPVNTPPEQWFNGRNSMSVRLLGINVGGYDGRGTFYFKYLTGTTAQLCSDIALTIPTDAGFTGTTQATVYGNSSTLYRSKPFNPLAWGVTNFINDIAVPSVYAYSIGGGHATAIAVLPSVSLLKIDFELPSQCVTFNLRNAGTDSFESSMRIVSNTYTAGSQSSQFLATLAKGTNALWSFDPRSLTLIQCDGSAQIPVGDEVFETLRDINQDTDHLFYVNGCYHSRLDLNLIFLNDGRSGSTKTSHCVYFHAPTGYWGLIDIINVITSAEVTHPITKEKIVLVGTYEGLLGEFGQADTYANWAIPNNFCVFGVSDGAGGYQGQAQTNGYEVEVSPATLTSDHVGIWFTAIFTNATDPNNIETYRRYIRVVTVNSSTTFTADLVLDETFAEAGPMPVALWNSSTIRVEIYIGLMEIQLGKFFNAKLPTIGKKIESVWYTTLTEDNGIDLILPHFVKLGSSYSFTNPEQLLQRMQSEVPIKAGTTITHRIKNNLTVLKGRTIGTLFLDRNPCFVRVMDSELHLTPDANTD